MEEEGDAAWPDQAAYKLLLLDFMGKICHKQGIVAWVPCTRCLFLSISGSWRRVSTAALG